MQNKGFTLKVWLPEAMTHDTTRDHGQVRDAGMYQRRLSSSCASHQRTDTVIVITCCSQARDQRHMLLYPIFDYRYWPHLGRNQEY